ncbi:MAG: sigma-70 family RNA polymerase sigma factor [Myxococcota bacterium]
MGAVVPAEKRELDPQVIRTALGQIATASAEAQRAAFTQLYLHYEPRVRFAVAKAVMRTRCKHRVADVRQDVWCRFATAKSNVLSYYDPQRGTFGSFISRLAYQQALKIAQSIRHKTHNTAQFETNDDDEADVEDPWTMEIYAQLIQAEFYDKLMERAEAALDDEERVMLHEIYFNGRSALSFAAARGINRNTIYKRHQRLKDKLHKFAAELLAHGPKSDDHPPHNPSLAAVVALIAASLAAPAMDGIDESGPLEWPGSSDDPDL